MIELPLLGRTKRKAIAKSDIEYTDYSCNPILGCSHACRYCYSRKIQLRFKQSPSAADWHRPKLYDNFLERLQEQIDAGQVKKDKEIFLSTMTDVYQRAASEHRIARKIIKILQDAGLMYRLLTKSPDIVNDADIFDGYQSGLVGLSITTDISNINQLKYWEPRTKPISERLWALETLSRYDISLWASVEPILPDTNIPLMLKDVIDKSNNQIKQIMIGKMNYEKDVDAKINWPEEIKIIRAIELENPAIHFHYKKETMDYLEKKNTELIT